VKDYLERLFSALASASCEFCLNRPSLVGNTGLLLTRVEYLSMEGQGTRGDRRGDERPVAPGSTMPGTSAAVRGVTAGTALRHCGPVCESADFSPGTRAHVAAGDLLAICRRRLRHDDELELQSRPRPAEVIVDGKKATLFGIGKYRSLFASERLLP